MPQNHTPGGFWNALDRTIPQSLVRTLEAIVLKGVQHTAGRPKEKLPLSRVNLSERLRGGCLQRVAVQGGMSPRRYHFSHQRPQDHASYRSRRGSLKRRLISPANM